MRVSVSICRKKSKGFVLLWANTDFFFLNMGVGMENVWSKQLSFPGFLPVPSWPCARQVRQVSPFVSVGEWGGRLRSWELSF